MKSTKLETNKWYAQKHDFGRNLYYVRKEQGENALKLFNDKFTVKVAALQIYQHFL